MHRFKYLRMRYENRHPFGTLNNSTKQNGTFCAAQLDSRSGWWGIVQNAGTFYQKMQLDGSISHRICRVVQYVQILAHCEFVFLHFPEG